MSRSPHEPTPETCKLVRTLAGVGQDQEDIARQVGICAKTLRLHYRDELDEGLVEAVAVVVSKLYELIASENIPAAIFADKCRGGKREEQPEKVKKKANKFTDPHWKAHWAREAAIHKKLSGHCGPERCDETVKMFIQNHLGTSYISHLDDDGLRTAIAQAEAYIKESEKDVETLVPYYEV
jgi:hypothetical protein